MKEKRLSTFFCLLLFFASFAFSAPLNSPSWGFSLDLPDDYVYTGGDGRDRFSFANPDGAQFDIAVYSSGSSTSYKSVEEMAKDVHSRLNNSGEMDAFEYRGKKAFLLSLSFSLGSGRNSERMSGWALCLELGSAVQPPLLLAMAYGPTAKTGLMLLHLSSLDSIAPEEADRRAPGPITEYSYPREKRIKASIFDLGDAYYGDAYPGDASNGIQAAIFEEDV